MQRKPESGEASERGEPAAAGGGAPARGRKAERSEATRAALVQAARALFAEHGYAAVGTEQIVRRAGVTRGALYHHFRDKVDLFRAAFEAVERDLAERIASRALATASDPMQALRAGREMFLESASEPEIQRIMLLDAPAVLGWEEWRAIGARYGLGLIEAALAAAMDAGSIGRLPTRPLAHVLLGALDEAALLVARAGDPDAARAEVSEALERLVAGLAFDAA